MEDMTDTPKREPYPTWRYRSDGDGGVEKGLFDHPDEVPDGDGWVDSPAYVNGAHAAPQGDGEGLDPPYDQYKFSKLRAEFKRRTGKGPKVGTSTEMLVTMLGDMDTEE